MTFTCDCDILRFLRAQVDRFAPDVVHADSKYGLQTEDAVACGGNHFPARLRFHVYWASFVSTSTFPGVSAQHCFALWCLSLVNFEGALRRHTEFYELLPVEERFNARRAIG